MNRSFVIVALLAACYSPPESRRTEYEPGSQVFRTEGEPLVLHVLQVDVSRNRRITMRVRFVNTGDDELSFRRANVSIAGDGVPARVARDLEWGGDVVLAAGARIDKHWGFHCDRNPEPGTYILTVAGIVHGDAESPRDLRFPIDVP